MQNLSFNFGEDNVHNLNKMTMEIMTVTPAMARVLLAKNWSENRPLRKKKVEEYAKIMSNGGWMLSPQGLIMTSDGTLINGQHRLMAVIRADVPVQFSVFTVDNKDVFKVLDQGANRNSSEVFNFDKRAADVVNFCCRLMTNRYSSVSPLQFEPIMKSVVGQISAELVDYCPTNRRGLSQAPVKSAAVSAVLFGSSKDYVFNLYRNLVLSDFDNLPPIGKAYLRQVNNGSIGFTKNNANKNTYARAYKLFAEENKDLTVIRMSGEQLLNIVRENSDRMRNMLISNGDITDSWGK